jgi:hypothetical protein
LQEVRVTPVVWVMLAAWVTPVGRVTLWVTPVAPVTPAEWRLQL